MENKSYNEKWNIKQKQCLTNKNRNYDQKIYKQW